MLTANSCGEVVLVSNVSEDNNSIEDNNSNLPWNCYLGISVIVWLFIIYGLV